MRQRIIFRFKRTKNLILRGLRSLRIRGLRASLAMVSPNLKRLNKNSALTQLSDQDIAALQQHNFECATPELSIIIPIHNRLVLSQACLAALIKHGSTAAYEVIVVNDGSEDDSARYFSTLTGLVYIEHAAAQGYVDSCNDGAAIARGKYLVFLNNDTQIQNQSLTALIATFDHYPDTGIVGAKLVYPNGVLQEAGAAIFDDGSAWNIGRFENANASEFNFVRECDYVSGAMLAIPKKLFHDLNGFDRLFSPGYYEDADLCFRARQSGFKVRYQPQACVMHIEGGTAGADTQAGMKAFQPIHQEKFRARWQPLLQQQPKKPEDAKAAAALIYAYRQKSILFIDEKMPTPDRDSGSLRLFSMMKLLSQENYAIGFASLNFQAAAPETEMLQCAGLQCFHQQSTDQKNILDWLEKNAHQFESIVVSRVTTMDALLAALRKFAPKAKIVFDTVDLHFLREQSEAKIKQSDLLEKQARASREKELILIQQCDETWVVSSTEFDLLQPMYPQKTLRIISNIHAMQAAAPAWQERTDLIFVANFRHPPNLDGLSWFIEYCWPFVIAKSSAIKLNIVGTGLVDTAQRKLQKENIIFHGHVADIQSALNSARINIAPLRYGAGAKGKISQALASGLPSVGTAAAIDGMFLEDQVSAIVADTAEGFADAVLSLYEDDSLWQRLSNNGLKVAERYFSEQAARRVLLEAFKTA
jgi:O-antigen biosynthesis protein